MSDHWLTDNLLDLTTTVLRSGNTTPDFDASLLVNPRVGRIMRHDAVDETLEVLLATTSPVSIIALFGGDLAQATGVRIQVGSADGLNDLLDVTLDAAAMDVDFAACQFIYRLVEDGGLAGPADARWVGITMTGFTDLGRVWLGDYHWSPEVGHLYGGGQGVDDLSTRNTNPRTGGVYVDRAARLRTHRVRYDAISPEERENKVRSLNLLSGESKQLLWIPDPDVYSLQKDSILGYLRNLSPIAAARYRAFDAQFNVRQSG